MKHLSSFFLGILLCSLLPLYADDIPMDAMREFRNQHGQRINASVVSVEGNQVTLRRTGDNLISLPIDSLNQRDQEFIQNWHIAYLIREFLRTEVSPRDNTQRFRDDPAREGQQIFSSYQLRMSNRNPLAIGRFKIIYKTYYLADDPHSNTTVKELKHERLETEISGISGNSTFLFSTQPLLIRDYRTSSPAHFVGTDRNTVNDELLGVKIIFQSGDFRPVVIKEPANLPDLLPQ